MAVPDDATPVTRWRSYAEAKQRMIIVARRVNRNRSVRIAARGGLAANGVVHILIGGIAVGIAHGLGGDASQNGAFSAIASSPGGYLLLWSAAFALFGLAVWQWSDAAWVTAPMRRSRVWRRLKDLGKAFGFALIGAATALFAAGRHGTSETAEAIGETMISTVGGLVVLLVLGGIVGALGGGLVYRGISRKFREETSGLHGALARIVDVLGMVGHVAKGLALLLVGCLLVYAAVFTDPNTVGGLDGALKYLASLPSGTILLDVVAAGLVAYGFYLLARSVFLPRYSDQPDD